MDASENVDNKDDIKLSGKWEVNGYGVPMYVNHQYELAYYKASVSPEIEFGHELYPKYPGSTARL